MAGTINDNISKLFDFAESALSTARSESSRISSSSTNVSGGNLSYTPTLPQISRPTAITDFLPVDNSSSTLRFLGEKTDVLVDQYFPEVGGCLRYPPEEWLCGIITGQKPFGLSKEVFEAVWHEGRDREYRARNSATQQIRSEFSQRGFSMPPGAMFKAILLQEELASDAIGALNRAQTVKDAEIKLDLLKFAEEQAIRLKLGVFQAIADYYRVLMELPNKDIEASRMKVAAYASLNDAVTSMHRVELGFEELRLQAANLRMNGKLDESRLKIAAQDGSRNAARAQSVQAFADVAAAVAGSASTLQADLDAGASAP